ncbi:hypothetical protein [Streptomyces fructofermentans]|uniref:Uncharacterized protein n=1 Tax=Streptomyces fructofermentans TaxID=152141 RepID=A0A918K1M7_9ACTN|nr:hypothetical protein [Streptomyces fructofermentans]GGX39711.1 hypothetical protein GCM10010515_02800 [Streptomyces fructofermentans]
MEQRIGSKSQPLDVAAVDPAYIPGLTPARSAEPEDAAVPEEESSAGTTADEAGAEKSVTGEKSPARSAGADAAAGGGSGTEAAEDGDAEADQDAKRAESAADPEAAEDADGSGDEGPVFEASDRRARVVADRSGVRLRLDDQEAEFRWDEIGAVETESPRFGKRFTVTVHTPDRRWYPLEIEATAKSLHKEWEAGLDEVLDAYFEDGAEDPADTDAPDTDAADASDASDASDATDSTDTADTAEAAAGPEGGAAEGDAGADAGAEPATKSEAAGQPGSGKGAKGVADAKGLKDAK